MHPILCRQALIFRWRIMCRPFFSRCLLLLCPCYDHCSDANQMRNGTPKLGVSLPKAELYLISKLPNTNVQIQTVISRISIFLSIGDKQPILWKEFWRSRKHPGCWPRVRRMQWMAVPVGDYSKWLTRTKLRLVPTNKFWFHLSCWQANVIWTKFGVTLLIRPELGLARALSPHLRSWGPQSRVVTWGLIMSQYTHYIQDSLSVPQSY